MRKFVKWSIIIIAVVCALALSVLGLYVGFEYMKAKQIPLDEQALLSPTLSIEVYDGENKPIKEDNQISTPYAKIDLLPQHTKDAFISIEDKDFYSHNGVNFKRILKATLSNLKAGKLKEGGSTITQQLVKNTQLTSEKTFQRKIKEVALAQKIESKYQKDEILQFYLNAIYFGNNCYGLESASNYYFSKEAKDLDCHESALLACIIKSPSKYCPVKNPENALKRRNLVISQMEKDGKITPSQKEYYSKQPLGLNLNHNKKNKLNSYAQASIDEAEKILKLPAKQIALKGYKIYTHQNEEKQKALEGAFPDEIDCDSAGVVIENKTGAISAFIGQSNFKILQAKRQPGSCIKPILVYGPALNEDLIYPCSQILDEEITVGDYTPKNVGNSYRGYVSAREALSKSINIPAVKVLSYVGLKKAKQYANEVGINFSPEDDSYSLALGGMTYGTDLVSLSGAYSTFGNQGIFNKPHFVWLITDKNDKIVYLAKEEGKKVFRDDSAYLLTDMLQTCAKTGTAKRLSSIECEIASKTGTVGKKNSKQNLDAWNISYSQNQTCGVWLGNLDNTPISYAGGNQPTEIVKNYFSNINDTSTFIVPSSIIQKKIDSSELAQNHRVMLATKFLPERYTQEETFSSFNLPNEVSSNFTTICSPEIESYVEGNNAIISFNAKDFITYQIKNNDKILKEISGVNGRQKITIPLSQNSQNITIENFYTLSPELNSSKEIKFIKKRPSTKEKWYI